MSRARAGTARRLLLAATAATWLAAWTVAAVGRDLRRARAVARLDPPATTIDVTIDPRSSADEERSVGRAAGPSADPIQLAALGDSAIAGVGADRVSDCLAVQIAARVATACGRPVQMRGYGMAGARTADIALQARKVDPSRPPQAIVVVVGANDVAHATAPTHYRRTVDWAHRDLRRRFEVPVVVCSLPEFRAISVVGGPLRLLAIGYGRALGMVQRRTLARIPGVEWVDARREAGPAFLQHPDAMSRDGYHPSNRGYALLADALAPAVVHALEEPPRSPGVGVRADR